MRSQFNCSTAQEPPIATRCGPKDVRRGKAIALAAATVVLALGGPIDEASAQFKGFGGGRAGGKTFNASPIRPQLVRPQTLKPQFVTPRGNGAGRGLVGNIGPLRPPKDTVPQRSAGDRPKGPTYDKGANSGEGRPGWSKPDRPKPNRAGEAKPDRNPPAYDPPRPPKLACDGGRVRGGNCVCPPGGQRRQVGRNAFECGSVVVVTPPGKTQPPLVAIPPRPPVIGNPTPPVRPPPTSPPPRLVDTPPDRPSPPAGRSVRLPPAVPLLPFGTGALPPVPPPSQQLAVNDANFVPEEVIARFDATTPQTLESDVAQLYGLQLLERDSLELIGVRIVRYRIPDGRTVDAVVASLTADARVTAPQPNFIYRRQQGIGQTPSSELQYALMKVNLGPTRALATGRGATIAVIDTAVDGEHPDLAGSDLHSFDATGDQSADKRVAPGVHGTAIAGIIAANGLTVGIAPRARLVSVNAFKSAADGSNPLSTTMILSKAMQRSVQEGARVINLSLAGPRDPLVEQMVGAIASRDVIMVAAAGNGGRAAPPAYPAAYTQVIAVTATDSADRLYAQSNLGTYIALAAPGVDILVPVPGRGHDVQSGTSFAAAHVSAVVALMLETSPALTAADARRALMDGAVDLGPPGRDTEFGAGRMNAAASLTLVSGSKR